MCLTPLTVKRKTVVHGEPKDALVPCGKCPQCAARRVSQWSFRLMQQDKIAKYSHFITLTYDTEHIPITKKGYMDLSKRDLQLFFKRLRKLVVSKSSTQESNIKYYAVGEYGGKSERPHYHVIIFNVYNLELIEKAWGAGSVHYGTVSGASIGYTLKYISKPNVYPKHKNDDRTKQFAVMSKGLAAHISMILKS